VCARIELALALEIVQAGNPVLRQKARALTPAEIASKEFQILIESMRETMYEAPGVGLAAPQIGLSVQLAVIEDRAEYHKDVPEDQLRERDRRPVPFHAIINPKIAQTSDDTVDFFEGCLSVTGFSALVPRARTVRVEFLDERGVNKTLEASGWHARILQHEIDHLNGILYIDRMRTRSFTSLDNWTQFWKGKPMSEIRKAFEADGTLPGFDPHPRPR
jgi:peptide deformylase